MTTPSTVLLYVPADPLIGVSPLSRVAGLPIAERVLRSAARAGYARTLVASHSPRLQALAATIDARVDVARSDPEWRQALASLPDDTTVTVVGPGTIVSPALLEAAARIGADEGQCADVPAGSPWPHTGVLRMQVARARDLAALRLELRAHLARVVPLPTGEQISKDGARLVIRLRSPRDLPDAERTLRRSIYKATDAKVARFNRRMSLPISIALMRTPVTANHVSLALVAFGFTAAWLFSRGQYGAGVAGALLSLAASVLDGCDGEIARLKYQESALGCWLETFGDYSYYLAIFAGLTAGAVKETGVPAYFWLGTLGLMGTIASFALLIYLRSRITAGRPETLHAVARARFKAEPTWWSAVVWRISFVATRAAMPYGILVLAFADLLPLVVLLCAIGANVYWIALALKLRDLLGAETERVAAA